MGTVILNRLEGRSLEEFPHYGTITGCGNHINEVYLNDINHSINHVLKFGDLAKDIQPIWVNRHIILPAVGYNSQSPGQIQKPVLIADHPCILHQGYNKFMLVIRFQHEHAGGLRWSYMDAQLGEWARVGGSQNVGTGPVNLESIYGSTWYKALYDSTFGVPTTPFEEVIRNPVYINTRTIMGDIPSNLLDWSTEKNAPDWNAIILRLKFGFIKNATKLTWRSTSNGGNPETAGMFYYGCGIFGAQLYFYME